MSLLATTLPEPQCRRLVYADGKPRPLLRGALHGCLSVALLGGVPYAIALGHPELAIGLLGKLITYAASATFHLYPFATVRGVTAAFVADIACVPFSLCGSALAFATSDSVVREACIALLALVLNGLAIAWQCQGQEGLRTRSDRSDTPRSAIVAVYSLWVSVFVGLSAGFGGLWPPCVALALLAGLLSGPVTEAHHLEPTHRWARWHRPGVWSLHEDFHLALALSDACWLVLAIQFERDHRTPVVRGVR